MPTHKACKDPDCTRAGKLLLLTEFYLSPNTKDGRQSYCKACSTRHRRMDWVPFKERRKPHPFELTPLFRNLNLTMACMNMVQQPLTEMLSEMILQADTKRDKETYEWARSMHKLTQQVMIHVDWIVKRKLEDMDNVES